MESRCVVTEHALVFSWRSFVNYRPRLQADRKSGTRGTCAESDTRTVSTICENVNSGVKCAIRTFVLGSPDTLSYFGGPRRGYP